MVKTYKQYRIIREGPGDDLTGRDFSERLNAALRELEDKSPRVTFEGMIARIEYTETEEVPGGIEAGEGRHKKTLVLHCEDCPHYEPLRRTDGGIDRRAKSGYCPFSKYMGHALRDNLVCETFIDLMENGELKIVKAKNAD